MDQMTPPEAPKMWRVQIGRRVWTDVRGWGFTEGIFSFTRVNGEVIGVRVPRRRLVKVTPL